MKRRSAALGKLLFWASLLLALVTIVFGYRYRAPSGVLCLQAVEQIDSTGVTAAPLPVRVVPTAEPALRRYRFSIGHLAGDRGPQAISIGEALPFYRLVVNGADLTPAIDLAARNVRDMAPHLHVLPDDVLRAGPNVAELTLPVAVELAEVRVDQICAGPLSALEPAYRANWWRMVGIPAICAILFCVLLALGVALWLLSARHPAYAWYVGCVALMLTRAVYVSTAYRPGSPLLWVLIGNVANALLPYVLYRFLCAYWRIVLPRLSLWLLGMTMVAALCSVQLYFMPRMTFAQTNFVVFLAITVSGIFLVLAAMARRIEALDRRERAVVLWVGLVAILGSAMEIVDLFQPFAQRWMWTKPPALTALALGFGYLLLRRMALGLELFAQASETLAHDIDHAISADTAPARVLWPTVEASISRRERGRIIRDIHDGFGSRLVAVLSRARHELPHSRLQRQVQRALLDMRLMLDAMDESSRSLGMAIARLRHRVDPLLSAAGIVSEWQVDEADDVRVDDRRMLIGVFRCLEELISNCIQHSGADRVVVSIAAADGWLQFRVEDNGCGAVRPVFVAERGLERARLRVASIGGSLRIVAAAVGDGWRCVLRVPLF